ncbi:hypothetical protein KDK_66600 [Dictyobacter kobayashii]|uniref:Tryptophan synthase beta chain-like PALP domain-containing protein n=1 Tax=Dictyobacter kobayashii TaxID=2014872 RepID=A0A402AUQ8_9CHLR|nr:pyridoxal-phosphate dependent enzyme [Dictyobacter kobayashii]GCE22860.1 hypothetical protein KDK_66600 [Dictyobacter kobayashii]
MHIVGATYADAWLASELRAKETGALVVHAYNQSEVVAGQGTLGYELSQQLPELDTLLVSVGGGGLISGIASWFQNSVRVIGVETEGTASMYRALQAGAPVDVEISGLAADALGARRVGDLPFSIAQRYVERVVLVNDEAIAQAQRSLWNELRLVAEPAAVAGIAALQAGVYQPAPNEHVGILICGGNAQLESLLSK